MNTSNFESILLRVLLSTLPIAGATSGCTGGTSCGDATEYSRVFPLHTASDAGTTDAGETDAGTTDGGVPATVTNDNCAEVCREREIANGVSSCGLTKDEKGQDAVSCTFVPYCEGRRPTGLASRPSLVGASEVGLFFARASHHEAASVFAFKILRDELRAHGAPRALVRAAIRSARDEVRHARMTAALARRYGETAPRPSVVRRPPRPLVEVAVENAVEGCVRETYGALVAAWQARAAADPMVRVAMRRIARDEARHAALGWEVARWAEARLGRAERARLAAARSAARLSLATEAGKQVSEALVRHAGLPRSAHAKVMAEELSRALA